MAGTRPVRAALVACLLQGGVAVRVQTELTEEVLAKGPIFNHVPPQSAQQDDLTRLPGNQAVEYGHTLKLVVKRTDAESSLEFGYISKQKDAETGVETDDTYTMDMKLEFLENEHGLYAPAHELCRNGYVTKCQNKCGWFLRNRCKRRCAAKEHKEDCMPLAGGRQVVASGPDAYSMTYTWPEQLRDRDSELTFEFTQQIPADFDQRWNDQYAEGKFRPVLHQAFWRVKINGREAPWLNRPRLLPLTNDNNEELHPNAFRLKGMTLQSVVVNDETDCTQPCSAEECTQPDGTSACYSDADREDNGGKIIVAQEHCYHYQNLQHGPSADEYERTCGLGKKAEQKLGSCCTGYPVPLSDGSLDVLLERHGGISPKGPWLSTLTGEIGSQIAFDLCRAYQGDFHVMATLRHPEVCRQMVERGEKVRLEGRVAFDGTKVWQGQFQQIPVFYKELLIVYRPLTQERMHLPIGMFTTKFHPAMKEASLPAGYWGMTVNDEGYITKVDPGSFAAMQGIVPNRLFINQLNEFAYGPGRWKQLHGKEVKLQMSETQTELTTGAQCIDEPGWKDRDRHDCARYADKEWCTVEGVVSENWKGHNRWFFWQRKYSIEDKAQKDTGISALDACCVCGGGQAKASVMIATSTTYAAPLEATTTAPPVVVSTTENMQKTCGNTNFCAEEGLGLVTKEGFEERSCPEGGCTADFCCDATCGYQANACPEGFSPKEGTINQRCILDSCDPYVKCCEYDSGKAAELLDVVECNACEPGTYLEFNVNMSNGDFNQFELGTNDAMRTQYRRAIVQAAAAAMSPHVAAEQMEVEFSQGSIMAKVLVKAQGDEQGFKLLGLMKKALFKENDQVLESPFLQQLRARMPDVSAVLVQGGKPEFVEIAEPIVGVVAAGRGVQSNPGQQFFDSIKTLPVIGGVAQEVGEVNAIALFVAGLFVFGFCCYANILNGDDDDFRATSDGMHAGHSSGSINSNLSAGRVPHGAGSVRSGLSSAASSAGGARSHSGTQAERTVAATIKVNVFGRSPPYPVRDEPREDMRFYHEWTSGLFDIEHDLTQAACALCCPVCFLPWRIRVTIEKVGTVEGVCCSMTKDNNWFTSVLCAFAYLVGVILLTHKFYCNQAVHMGVPFLPGVCNEFAVPNSADLKYEDVSLAWYLLIVLPMIWRQLVMHKGIATRYQIQENDVVAFIKAIFFTPFASMQSGRHVDTYYKEHTVKRVTDVPKLPLLGTPIKIRPGPAVEDFEDDLDKR